MNRLQKNTGSFYFSEKSCYLHVEEEEKQLNPLHTLAETFQFIFAWLYCVVRQANYFEVVKFKMTSLEMLGRTNPLSV